ncbi:MAG: cation:proton antiporter [Candidatus Woesearchaeota archaeon]
MSFIYEFGILLIFVMIVSFFIKLLKQPIIIGYVLSGILAGIFIIKDNIAKENIIILSEIGITFLLFLMGLEFDLKELKYMGKDIIISAIIQSIILFIIAYVTSSFFGFSSMERIFISIIFIFSSTLLVAKWLEDKKETVTLHGKIILGILIVQDIIAIIAITFLGVIQEASYINILLAPIGGIVLLLIAIVMSKYLLNWPLKVASKYPELLFVISIGICFLFVVIAALLRYSETIGAFIAGIVLANTLYKREIITRLKPLIIFFNMLFFIGLGFKMGFGFEFNILLFIGIMVILTLFIKPAVIYFSLKLRGYDAKTSFISAISLSQLSEFGIIIISGAIYFGTIDKILGAICLIIVIFTMLISSYYIKYDNSIFKFFEPLLLKLEKYFTKKADSKEKTDLKCNIIFFGYYDLSREFYSNIEILGKRILVIENDPQNIELLKKEGIRYIYNSYRDAEFLEHLDFSEIELLVSSIIDLDDTKLILRLLKKSNPSSIAIVTAKNLKNALDLYDNHADYVIYPSYLNEQQVSVLLEDYTADINKVLTKKIIEISKLKEKQTKIESHIRKGESLARRIKKKLPYFKE